MTDSGEDQERVILCQSLVRVATGCESMRNPFIFEPGYEKKVHCGSHFRTIFRILRWCVTEDRLSWRETGPLVGHLARRICRSSTHEGIRDFVFLLENFAFSNS